MLGPGARFTNPNAAVLESRPVLLARLQLQISPDAGEATLTSLRRSPASPSASLPSPEHHENNSECSDDLLDAL